MKLLFIRHGESKSQAKEIESTASDAVNLLSETGIEQVKTAAQDFHGNIDAVYSSPYNRTKITAQLFLDTLGIHRKIIIDERLKEIDYGYHDGEVARKEDLEAVAIEQIAGDYEIRFGHTGENKREIVTRLFNFVIDIFNTCKPDDTVLAVSHGRAISIFEHEFYEINKIAGPRSNLCAEGGRTKNARIKEFDLNAQYIKNMVQRLKKLNETK